MKFEIKKEKSSFKPTELTIKIETLEEEVFWLTILNSSVSAWRDFYNTNRNDFPKIVSLSDEEVRVCASSLSEFYYLLDAKTTEDTSDD